MANLQGTVKIEVSGTAEIKQLSTELKALDKSLQGIQQKTTSFATSMKSIATSMTTASRETAKFATAIEKADAKLGKFRENMKGATGRTKNVTAGINEASFQRAIDLTQKLSKELAELAKLMKLVPRSKTINVNAKMNESKPVSSQSNTSKAKETSFTDTGFVEGIGEVNFADIKKFQQNFADLRQGIEKEVLPIQQFLKEFSVKSQMSLKEAFKVPANSMNDLQLASRNVRSFAQADVQEIMAQYGKLKNIYDNVPKTDSVDFSKPFYDLTTNSNLLQESINRTQASMNQLVRETRKMSAIKLPSLPAPSNAVQLGIETEGFSQFEKAYNLWDKLDGKKFGSIDMSKPFVEGATGANQLLSAVERVKVAYNEMAVTASALTPKLLAPSNAINKSMEDLKKKMFTTPDFGSYDINKPFMDMKGNINSLEMQLDKMFEGTSARFRQMAEQQGNFMKGVNYDFKIPKPAEMPTYDQLLTKIAEINSGYQTMSGILGHIKSQSVLPEGLAGATDFAKRRNDELLRELEVTKLINTQRRKASELIAREKRELIDKMGIVKYEQMMAKKGWDSVPQFKDQTSAFLESNTALARMSTQAKDVSVSIGKMNSVYSQFAESAPRLEMTNVPSASGTQALNNYQAQIAKVNEFKSTLVGANPLVKNFATEVANAGSKAMNVDFSKFKTLPSDFSSANSQLRQMTDSFKRMSDISKLQSQSVQAQFRTVPTGTGSSLVKELEATDRILKDVGNSAKKARSQIGYMMHAVGTSLVLTALFTLPQAFLGAITGARQLEAQMQSLDRVFGEGANEIKRWAENASESFGLSTKQAINGASQFGNVVGTFAKSSQQMNGLSIALMQQVSVVASQTGRTVDDVTKRFISGMLGGTEAIENLGIFVRQSALQATQAYKDIVGERSWDKLSQATQNQVYTMAILEQSYKRYGNAVNPAMLETMKFTAQLQNLGTNIGRAFVPMVNAVLPILNKLISWLSTAMAYVSAFFSLLFGKSAGNSMSSAEGAVGGMADASSDFADYTGESADNLDDASKSAKEIKRSLAGFDEINLITQTGGDETDTGAGGSDIGDLGGIEIPDFGQAGDYITQFQEKVQSVMDTVKRFMELFAPLGLAIATAFAFIQAMMYPLATPIALIALGIGALIAVIVDLWNTSDGFRDAVIGAWERIQKVFEIVWVNVLEPFLSGFSEGMMVVYNIVKKVIEIVSILALGALSLLLDALVWVLEKFGITADKGSWLAGIMENLGIIVGVIAGVFTVYALAMGIASGVMTAWSAIIGVWTTVTTIATGVGGVFATVIAFIASPVFLVILAIGALIAIGYLLWKNWDWLSEKATEAFSWIATKWEEAMTAISDWWSSTSEWLTAKWTQMWDWINKKIDDLVAWFKAIPQRIGDFFSKTNETFKRGVEISWNWVSGKISDLVNWFKNIAGRIGDFFASVHATFKNGVDIAWNWVSGKISTLVGWFTGIPNRIGNFFGGVVTSMKNSINGAWDWVNRKVNDLVQWFKDIPSNIGNSVSGFFGNIFGGKSIEVGINGTIGTSGMNFNADGLPTNTPYLANGGLAFGKTTAVIGEYAGASSNPEVVAPLDKLTEIIVSAVTGATSNGNGKGQDLYVNLEVDGTRFAKAVVKNVNDYTKATGRKVLKV